eukprot:Gb_12988 [translate_table: standard]
MAEAWWWELWPCLTGEPSISVINASPTEPLEEVKLSEGQAYKAQKKKRKVTKREDLLVMCKQLKERLMKKQSVFKGVVEGVEIPPEASKRNEGIEESTDKTL